MNVNRPITSDGPTGVSGAPQPPSDAELAHRAADGDRHAAGLLIERHQLMVRHFLRRLTGCDATADDLAQETFVRMLRYAHRYDDRYAMRTWLLTIARRLCINHGRTIGRTVTGPHTPDLTSAEPDPADRAAQAEDGHRLRASLHQAMQQLTHSQREAVLLFHQQGLSIHDTAEVMDLPANTVKSHLHRGRAALRRLLGHLAEHQP